MSKVKSVKTNKTTFKSADERRTVTPVMTEEEILREKGGHII